ncbi:hypothetical protein ACQ661_07520 [Pseudidiomarina sp. WS423]|uniref:hypothetical protein n=1 Tax=Pseudidiomarina sp. WS423 TaxID=3425124 RepID=UPI003D6FF4A6
MSMFNSIDFADPKTRTQLFIFVAVVMIISWITLIDQFAVDYVNDALAQATIAFASARLANAIVATLQSFSFEFYSMQLAFGEALSPLHDMIEEFSDVMKAAIVSLLLQKLLVEIVSDFTFNTLLSVSAVTFTVSLFFKKVRYQLIAFKVFLTLAALRYLVVFVVVLNGTVAMLFLDETIEKQTVIVSSVEDSVRSIEKSTPQISRELKQELEAEISQLDQQLEQLQQRQSQLELELRDSLRTLNEHKEKRAQILESMPTTERYNPLAKNPELDNLKILISALENIIEDGEDELDDNKEQQQDIVEAKMTFEAELRGEPTGFLDSISKSISNLGDKISGFRDAFKYEKIKDLMTDAIDAMLKAIVPFILKAILLPLLFLFLFSRIFKTIWNININVLDPLNQNKKTDEKPEQKTEPSNA